jgi:ribosomal-protein-alanine N-acetyltransferase
MMLERILGDIRIRLMGFADLNAVAELDQKAFSLPWPKRAFENELTNPMAKNWVVDLHREKDAPLIASMIVWLILDEVHIATIALEPAYRQHGIGKVLLAHALLQAYEEGARSSLLEVRRSNEAALALYRSAGYIEVGVRKKYYSDNKEDALLMNLEEINPAYCQTILQKNEQMIVEVQQ